jgi:hypothetical protein
MAAYITGGGEVHYLNGKSAQRGTRAQRAEE